MTDNEKQDLINQLNKLDEIYGMKAEGAFVRSRRKWLEGEQNTAYFFRLERSHAKNSIIKKLNIDRDITDDPKRIASYCSNFYCALYESYYNEELSCQFLESLTETKSIDTDQKYYCDRPITLDEVIFVPT